MEVDVTLQKKVMLTLAVSVLAVIFSASLVFWTAHSSSDAVSGYLARGNPIAKDSLTLTSEFWAYDGDLNLYAVSIGQGALEAPIASQAYVNALQFRSAMTTTLRQLEGFAVSAHVPTPVAPGATPGRASLAQPHVDGDRSTRPRVTVPRKPVSARRVGWTASSGAGTRRTVRGCSR